tara:strand:+ start:166 stop:363 length:198 start_codon:yes stop_codon:yes gene_type:complete
MKKYKVIYHDTYKWAKVETVFEVEANRKKEAIERVFRGDGIEVSSKILNLDNLKSEAFQRAEEIK